MYDASGSKRVSLHREDLLAFDIIRSQTDTNKCRRLSLRDDKSRLNASGLRESKRRKTCFKEENHVNGFVSAEIRSPRNPSSTGTPILNVTNGVWRSVVPSISSSTSATSLKPTSGSPRMSRKIIESCWASHIAKPSQKDFLRSSSRPPVANSKVPKNKIEPCHNATTEPKMWTDEYSPASLSEMVLHSSEIVPLLEWMRLWDTDSWTARAKNSSHPSAGKRLRVNSYGSSLLEPLNSLRCSAYLIFGPTGCGKTSLIYALATQYGYKVFEVNSSSCRSGREVTSQCSPVMVSQHVSTEALSASSSASDLSKVSILSSDKAMFQSRKSTLDPYSLPNKRPFSRNISQLDSLKRGASEGLKLINKSLILFDDVDVLFDADRGFWHAVGKLLQMGRRPIFFTASDPSVLRKIPVPYQTCKLLPLPSSALAKPILQRICDSRGLILTDSLMLALTRRDDEDCNFDMPVCISSTAKEVVNSRVFSNIRQSIVRLQWITGSGNQHLDGESTRTGGYDLMNACNSTFHRLFSLSFAIPQISSQGPAKSTGDEFVDVFASDVEEKPLGSEEHEKQLKTSNAVKLPLPQCRKLSADVLSELFRATESQALLDMCSAVSGRNEISRGIESLPLNITSSSNLMTVFGDVCSAPLSGIDPVGISGTFVCEEEWRRLLHLTTLHNLTRLEERLLSIPVDSESLSFGSYIDEHSAKDYFSSVVFDKAVGTLASLRAFNEERKSGDCFFQRESALDFLPALRSIGRAESRRKSSATRRRFFHYFDQIGLCLPQDVRKFLSQ